MKNMEFAVIGGDMRQVKLAELLSKDGHNVSVFALDRAEPEGVNVRGSIKKAVEKSRCVVLPLPARSNDGALNAPLSEGTYSTEDVFSVLKPEQLVAAGRIDKGTYALAESYGLKLVDYYEREELVIANAVATAEGAVQIAMEETPITLLNSRCLVIGHGRIGKILAHRLKGMGAEVTVSARKYADMAWIDAYGYKSLHTERLRGHLGGFDIILNTAPVRVLDQKCLEEVDKDCLIIDLSSKPGGMDFVAAGNLGLEAVWALSLPGEVAPVTSGKTIKNTIYNIIDEQGLTQTF